MADVFLKNAGKRRVSPKKVLLPAYLLHQVLVRLLDAGVGDGFLRVADGVNDVSLTALPVTTTPAAQRRHKEFRFYPP